VHLSAHGHPIVGDDLYGGASRWRGVRDSARRRALAAVARPLLHAERVVIEELGIDAAAPLPEDYAGALAALTTRKTPP
jgi:23S rRNA-/tRNA-specific pseudouridylate synthase